MQRGDFVELFEIMKGLPVTIRLLDPPLHEFLPHTRGGDRRGRRRRWAPIRSKLDATAPRELHEFNPMLGFRGCRLAIAYPEIAEMQARAIFEAAVEAGKRTGEPVVPEVMVPLIATKAEFDLVKARIDAMAEAVAKETGTKVDYQVGTMIELPRACLMAGEIAETRRVLLLRHQRPDADHVRHQPRRRRELPRHLHRSAASSPVDPFVSIDREGVGELVRIGVERGRKARHELKLGICGEHGGDPASVAFCHEVGLDYVSCSPFRVPIARLAAAQAALGKDAASQA